MLREEMPARLTLANPKSKNLGVAALGDEDVRGLNVTVDDVFCVSGVEGVRNLDGQR